MRKINLETWPRREHFKLYGSFNHPHFNMCANMDLTVFYPFIKQHGISFNIATIYLLTRTANEIPAFRLRIHGDDVVEHEIVHPSSTILVEDDLFTFCDMDYVANFSEFAVKAAERVTYVKENPALRSNPKQDNRLYMTAIPWVSFTSFMHPMQQHPTDSIPRFAWGKFFEEGQSIKMPLSVQGHHALMDGIHMGWFYEKAQMYFRQPELIFDIE